MLPKLEHCSVGGNQLASIENVLPPEIRLLKLPATEEGGELEKYIKVGPYSTMRTLRIGQNRVTKIPLNFAQLFVNLKQLVANKNGISMLPVDMFDLPMLEVLVLSKNELSSLPNVNNPKIRLRCLVLSKNQFGDIPASIGKISLLQKLYLDNNQIEGLTKALGSLKYMYKLDLSMNQINGDSVLASGLLKSATLHNIKLKPGNPNIPKDLSSKENFEASPLASPLRRMTNASPMGSPVSKRSGDGSDSEYGDPSPRRVEQ